MEFTGTKTIRQHSQNASLATALANMKKKSLSVAGMALAHALSAARYMDMNLPGPSSKFMAHEDMSLELVGTITENPAVPDRSKLLQVALAKRAWRKEKLPKETE